MSLLNRFRSKGVQSELDKKWGDTSGIHPATADFNSVESKYTSTSNFTLFSGASSSSQGLGFLGMKFSDSLSPQALGIMFYRLSDNKGYIQYMQRKNGTWTYSTAIKM